MKTLRLSGIIGYDVTPDSVSEVLDQLGEEDLHVLLYTRGGNVADGIEIYNLFANYKGKKSVEMGSIVASIGTYITTAFGENTEALDTTSYMIHNVHNGVFGDYKAFQKEAVELERLNLKVAKGLAKYSGMSEEEVLGLMDTTTWYHGQEIVDAGFARSLRVTGENTSREVALADAKKEYFKAIKEATAAKWYGEIKHPKDGMRSVALYDSEDDEVPMEKKEILSALNGLIVEDKIKLDEVAKLFGATDKIMSDEQKSLLDALNTVECKDPGKEIPELRTKAATAADAEQQNLLTKHFGIEGEKNKLRSYAQNMIKTGMKIEDIQKDPIAQTLAAAQADGGSSTNLGIVDKEPDDKNKKKDATAVYTY